MPKNRCNELKINDIEDVNKNVVKMLFLPLNPFKTNLFKRLLWLLTIAFFD